MLAHVVRDKVATARVATSGMKSGDEGTSLLSSSVCSAPLDLIASTECDDCELTLHPSDVA